MEFEHLVKQYQDQMGKAGIAITTKEARLAVRPIFDTLQKDKNVNLLSLMMQKLKQLTLNSEITTQKFISMLDELGDYANSNAAAKDFEFQTLQRKHQDQLKQKAQYIEQQNKTQQILDEYIQKAIQDAIVKLQSPNVSSPLIAHTKQKQKAEVIVPPVQPPLAPKRKTIIVSGAAERNQRQHMEDTMIIDEALTFTNNEPARYNFFAIFDGHAGDRAAKYLAKQFVPKMKQIAGAVVVATTDKKIHPDKHADTFLGSVLQQTMSTLIENWDKNINGAKSDTSGSTATMLLIDRKTGFATFLNLGDSRSVLYQNDKDKTLKPNQLVLHQTIDHDLDSKQEVALVKKRRHLITGEFCRVTKTPNDVPRVNDNIAMSRSFGDNGETTIGCMGREVDLHTFNIKNQPTIAVLASDGLWDEYDIAEVGKMVAHDRMDASRIVQRVVKHGKVGDNCTVIVVDICPQSCLK